MGNCFQNCDKNISIKIDIYIYIFFSYKKIKLIFRSFLHRAYIYKLYFTHVASSIHSLNIARSLKCLIEEKRPLF